MAIPRAFPRYAPLQPPTKDGRSSYVLSVRPELVRLCAYIGFVLMYVFARFVTKIWTEPLLELGAVNEPPERQGCGPFNRNTDHFGLSYGDGFTMEETHLEENLGYANICTEWDYSPSREVIAMYFPLVEYLVAIYTVLDFVSHMLAYGKGELPEWYWKVIKITDPLQILFFVWFRMVFVFTVYEEMRFHTASFLLFQVSLYMMVVTNGMYVMLSGQSYPSIGLTAEKTAQYAKIYIFFTTVVSLVKIYGTLYIVLSADVVSPAFYRIPVAGMFLGQIIDYKWLFFNLILAAAISYIRMKDEDPVTIEFTAPPSLYDPDTKPSSKPPSGGDGGKASDENTPLLAGGGSSGGTQGGSVAMQDIEDPSSKTIPKAPAAPPAPVVPPAPAAVEPTPPPAEPEPEPEPPKKAPVVDPKIILGQGALDAIKGTPSLNSGLSEIYNEIGHKAVEIWIQDGGWIKEVFLPLDVPEGSKLTVHCNSTWNTHIKNLKPVDREVGTKQKVALQVVNGVWKEISWVDEKGTKVIKGQAELNRFKGTTGAYFLVVVNKKVVHHSGDLEDCKKYLMTKFGKGANRPSRMICEVTNGKVVEDPHTVGGQNQGAGVNAGFNKWWMGWGEIHAMQAVARAYLRTNKVGGPPGNDNLLHLFNTQDYKDVELQTWDGSWIKTVILPNPDSIIVNSTFTVKCGSSWSVKVNYPGKWTKEVKTKVPLTLKVKTNGTKKVWA
jgi:hypothetical protein